MSHYKPYPKYKDSGVEWLGEVPEHWEVKRLKHIASVLLSNVDKHMVEGQKGVKLCNYLDVYNNTHITSKIDFMSATASDEQIERLSLQKDDVIITKDSEDPSDIGIPALVEEDIFGLVCGYHLAILRPTLADGEFLHYFLQSIFVRSVFEVEATGMTRYALGKYSIENLTFALPHRSEQTSIASFLDGETSRIDSLISEKERLISLLQEYRQALISHAVTKGLDPKVKMKDSGVEWLGEIPEHWKILRLKRVFESMEYGISESLSPDGEIPILRMSNIDDGRVFWDDLKFVDAVEDSMYLQNGDLLFNRTNSLDLVGKVGLFEENETFKGVSFASYLVRLRPNNRANSKYLDYLLNIPSFLSEVRSNAIPAIGQANLNPTRYGYLLVAVPPLEEQENINDLLDHETSRIDTLISEGKKFIDLLKEYRSSLITAAVTGKINVREDVPSGSEKREIAHE